MTHSMFHVEHWVGYLGRYDVVLVIAFCYHYYSFNKYKENIMGYSLIKFKLEDIISENIDDDDDLFIACSKMIDEISFLLSQELNDEQNATFQKELLSIKFRIESFSDIEESNNA